MEIKTLNRYARNVVQFTFLLDLKYTNKDINSNIYIVDEGGLNSIRLGATFDES